LKIGVVRDGLSWRDVAARLFAQIFAVKASLQPDGSTATLYGLDWESFVILSGSPISSMFR
jgi:hypothetical protein